MTTDIDPGVRTLAEAWRCDDRDDLGGCPLGDVADGRPPDPVRLRNELIWLRGAANAYDEESQRQIARLVEALAPLAVTA